MIRSDSGFLRQLWALVRPYWVSEERLPALGLLAAVVGLTLAMVYVNVLLNDWQNLFFNSLQNRDAYAFFRLLAHFSVLAAAFIAMAVYQLYLNQMLQIRWRRWLTDKYLGEWLADRAYYRLQLEGRGTDNPDQRIADDIRLFVADTLGLTLGLINAVVTLASFAGILWRLSGTLAFSLDGKALAIPGYLVWAALLYAVAGSWLTHRIGRPLAGLDFHQQRAEADFRFALARLRENAEAVALYGGEQWELAGFRRRFRAVVENWWAIMKRQKLLTWFTSGYAQVAVVFPYFVAAPRYFAGALTLGGLMQSASAFGQVQGSLSWAIGAYSTLASWKATVDRLVSFRRAVRRPAPDSGPARISGAEALGLEGLRLRLPGGAALPLAVSARLRPGQAVLIEGPSGIGKSTLFKAIAGLWPYAEGRIRVPGGRFLFLSQKPYLPLGSLREALCYPSPPEAFDDPQVGEALAACGLGHLAPLLDQTDNWSARLSPGEQQRLSVARALLHRPDWLFLDEATSALEEAAEAQLYRLLKERLPRTTLVSIGHRSSLRDHHDLRLSLDAHAAAPA